MALDLDAVNFDDLPDEDTPQSPLVELPGLVEDALQQDPGTYAKAMQLSRETEIPVDVVLQDPTFAEAQRKLSKVDFSALEDAPATKEFLYDYNNAVVAQDDIDKLSNTEKILRSFLADPMSAIGSSIRGVGRVLDMAARRTQEADMRRMRESGDPESIRRAEEYYATLEGRRKEAPTGSMLEDTASGRFNLAGETGSRLERSGQAFRGFDPATEGTLATEISGAVGTTAALAAGSVLAPWATAFATYGMGVEEQAQRQEASGALGSSDAADAALLTGGLIETGSEKIGAELLLRRVPPRIRNAVARRASDLLLAAAGETVSEGAAGLGQDVLEKYTTNEEAQVGITTDEMLVSGSAGTIVRAVLQAAMPGRVGAYESREMADVKKGMAQAKTLDDLAAQSQATKIRETAPGEYRQALKAQGADDISVFIDGAQASLFLREKTPEDIQADPALQLIKAKIEQSQSLGTDLRISATEFMETVAPSAAYADLKTLMTMTPDAVSPFRAEQDADVRRRTVDSFVGKAKENMAAYAEAQDIYETVKDQLIDTGKYSEADAKILAQVVPAWAVARSSRTGIPVRQIYQEAGLRIEGPMTGKMEQLSLYAQEGQPGEVLLNIGRAIPVANIGDEPTFLDAEEIRQVLKEEGVDILGDAEFESNTEPTMVIQVAQALSPEQAYRISERLQQDAIVQRVGKSGALYGPNAEAWGDYNPEYFVMPDGTRASEYENGRRFTKFFGNVVTGETGKPYNNVYEPQIPELQKLIDDVTSDFGKYHAEYEKHKGNFDNHIALSIPGYRDFQYAIGIAIGKTVKDGTMLDIGASQGTQAKTITSLSGGKIKTLSLDPNVDMAKSFYDISQVEGAEYDMSALGMKGETGLAWVETKEDEESGAVLSEKEIYYFEDKGRTFDVVQESMTFQFIDNDRRSHIARMAELTSPEGLVIVQEKVFTDAWAANEAKKNAYKSRFFRKEDMDAKATEVLEGMVKNMVAEQELVAALHEKFDYVEQIWDSGNFKGFVASNSKDKISEFMKNLPNTETEYDTRANPNTPDMFAQMPLPPTVEVDGKQRPTSNSQGRPLAPTAEGVVKFWQWFGDSKAVDDQGRPLVLYHGTGREFDEFKTGRAKAMYFTTDRDYASEYGSRIVEVYLRIEKPLDVLNNSEDLSSAIALFNDGGGWGHNPDFVEDDRGGVSDFNPEEDSQWSLIDQPGFTLEIQARGYDGFIGNEAEPGRGALPGYAVFDPAQIKSATGNTGEFSPSRPEIFAQSWYYSPTLAAAEALKQEKGTPEQMIAMLRNGGAKVKEMEAIGLPEYLQLLGKTVTKQQIIDFVQANGVTVEEVTYGGVPDVYEENGKWYVVGNEFLGYSPTEGAARTLARREDVYAERMPQYKDYTTVGGDGYTELLLTLPDRLPPGFEVRRAEKYPGDTWFAAFINGVEVPDSRWPDEEGVRQRALMDEESRFRSSHWVGVPNVLAHVRFKERADADGKKVLLLEEIQSDWAQEGREKGFIEKYKPEEVVLIEDRARLDAYGHEDLFWYFDVPDNMLQIPKSRHATAEEAKAYILREKKKKGRIAPGPFVQNTDAWVGLVVKRMLAHAVENGFDRIAWVPGEMQAERYGLRGVVEKIYVDNYDKAADTSDVSLYLKGDEYFQFTVDRENREILDSARRNGEQFVGKTLYELLGKEVTDSVMLLDDGGSMSGNEIPIGGEGMKEFYDRIVPGIVRDITKKMDKQAGIRTTKFTGAVTENMTEEARKYAERFGDTEFSAMSFDITDGIRESVSQGVSLFQKGKGPGARGYYSPSERLIRLTDAADLSTFLHEFGHFMFEMEPADSEIRRDINTWHYKNADLVAAEANTYLGRVKKELEQPAAHGSGRLFSAFSRKYVGTGEGGLAYGWGLYFTGSDDLAAHYARSQAAATGEGYVYAVEVPDDDILLHNDKLLSEQPEPVRERLKDVLAKFAPDKTARVVMVDGAPVDKMDPLYRAAIQVDRLGFDAYLARQMELMANAEKLGNADEIARQQANLGAAMSLDGKKIQVKDEKIVSTVDSVTGEKLYNQMVIAFGGDKKKASDYLLSLGIPGLTYQGALGDKNFVVWDDAVVKVSDVSTQQHEMDLLKELGQPLLGDQGDLFAKDFVTKRAKVDGVKNINSRGGIVTATRQGLENFARFFKGSKAVDKEGRPLLMFHSTNGDFSTFEVGKETKNYTNWGGEYSIRRGGVFVSPDRKFSQEYLREGSGGNVMPLYISVKKPLDLRKGMSLYDEEEILAAGGEGAIRQYRYSSNDWALFDEGPAGDFAFIDALKAAGFDGAVFTEDDQEGDARETWVVFSSDQIKSATGNRGTFDESADILTQPSVGGVGAAPGSITEYDVRKYITGGTTGESAKDAAIREALHEQFARAWETYLMEGKAPSVELRKAFRKFASWLVEIYRAIRGDLNVRMDDNIRSVFDRLIATDEQIEVAAARAEFEPLFTDAAMAGMTEEQYARYLEKATEAKDEAKETVRDKLIRELRRSLTKEWREEKADVIDEITPAIQKEKVYAAMDRLKADLVLDKAAVKAMVGETATSKKGTEFVRVPIALRGMTKDGGEGMDPDLAAALLGYSSGAEMLHDIMKATPLRKEAEDRAEKILQARHGDSLNDGTVERMADEALAGESRAEMLVDELNALMDVDAKKYGSALLSEFRTLTKDGQRKIERQAIQDLAAERIGRLSYREIHPGVYRKAEIRAARDAGEAIAKGDRNAAAEAKLRQLINFYLGKEATAAKERIEGVVGKMSRYEKKTVREAIMKSDGGHWEQIRKILRRFEFRKSATLSSVEEGNVAVQSWMLDRIANHGDGLVLTPQVLDETFKTHWKNIPFTELLGVFDSIKNIEHVARYSNKIDFLQDKMDYDTLVTKWVESIEANGETVYEPKRTDVAEGKRTLPWGIAQMTKIPFLASWLDGGERVGITHDIIVQPFTDAFDVKQRLWRQTGEVVVRAVEESLPEDRARRAKKIYIPEIGDSLYGHQILAVALNVGNASNLRKLLLGEGWADENFPESVAIDNPKLQAVLRHMSKSDWDLVQLIWDQMELLYPQLADVHRRTTGMAPPKVDATPVTTAYGIYTGGYYPVKYDPERSTKAEDFQEKADAETESMFGSAGIQASVTAGATNERTGYFAPIRLSLDVVPNHFQETIHYISHHDAVRSVNRLIRDPRVAKAIKSKVGPYEFAQLKPWLNDIAKDGKEAPTKFFWEKALQRLRFGATLGYMGFKASTGLLQLTGLATAAGEVGPANLLRGMRMMLRDTGEMQGAMEFAVANSKVMAYRAKEFDRDVSAAFDRLADKTGFMAAVQELSLKHIALIQTYIVDLPTWYGAYAKELKLSGDEEKAFKYADWTVENIHGSGRTANQAAILRSQKESDKMFTMFMTFFSSMWNMERDLVRGAKKGGRYSAADVGARAMFLFIIPVLAEMLLRGELLGGDEDDEETVAEKALLKMALFPMASVPFLRDVVSGLAGGFGYNMSPINQLLETGVTRIPKLIEGTLTDEEVTRSTAKGSFIFAGAAFGIPGTSQAWGTAEHLYQVLEEGEELTVKELLYGPERK